MKSVCHVSNWLALSYPDSNWVQEEKLEQLPTCSATDTENSPSWSFFGNYLEQVSNFNSIKVSPKPKSRSSKQIRRSKTTTKPTALSNSSEDEIEKRRAYWREKAERRKQKILAEEGGAERRRVYWRAQRERKLEKMKLEAGMKATAATKNKNVVVETKIKATTIAKKNKLVPKADIKVEVKKERKKKVDDIKTSRKAASTPTSKTALSCSTSKVTEVNKTPGETQPRKKGRPPTRADPKSAKDKAAIERMKKYMAASYRARMADPVKREKLKMQMRAAALRLREKNKKRHVPTPATQKPPKAKPHVETSKEKVKSIKIRSNENSTRVGLRKSSRNKDGPPKNYFEP